MVIDFDGFITLTDQQQDDIILFLLHVCFQQSSHLIWSLNC